MAQIIAYLSFNGNCREAMHFYQHCLGGRLCLQTLDDSPLSSGLPVSMKKNILQASLVNDSFILLGSDLIGSEKLVPGNSIALMYHCRSLEELQHLYNQLHGSFNSHSKKLFVGQQEKFEIVDQFGVFWVLSWNEVQQL